eukprot:scaffold2771_cov252-Pinguiococcus_pyrenoidosus.AAC.9
MGVSKKLPNIEMCTSASGTHGYMAPEVYKRGHEHGEQQGRPDAGRKGGTKIADPTFAFQAQQPNGSLLERPFDQKKIQSAAKMEYEAAREAFPLKYLRDATHVTEAAGSICSSMLAFNPAERCGKLQGRGLEEYRAHPWFKGFPWDSIAQRQHPAPFKPDVTKANFDTSIADVEEMLNEPPRPTPIRPEDQIRFKGYEFNVSFDSDAELRRIEQVRLESRADGKKRLFRGTVSPLPKPTADN